MLVHRLKKTWGGSREWMLIGHSYDVFYLFHTGIQSYHNKGFSIHDLSLDSISLLLLNSMLENLMAIYSSKCHGYASKQLMDTTTETFQIAPCLGRYPAGIQCIMGFWRQNGVILPGKNWLVGALIWACLAILKAVSGFDALRFAQNPVVLLTPSGVLWNSNTSSTSTGSTAEKKNKKTCMVRVGVLNECLKGKVYYHLSY